LPISFSVVTVSVSVHGDTNNMITKQDSLQLQLDFGKFFATKQDIFRMQKHFELAFATKKDFIELKKENVGIKKDLREIKRSILELEQKLDIFTAEIKETIYTALDQVVGVTKTITQEHAALHYRVKEHSDQLALHDKRLDKLESKPV